MLCCALFEGRQFDSLTLPFLSGGFFSGLTQDTQRDQEAYPARDSAALVIDKVLMDLLKVRMDTPLEVTTDGKNIIISPQTKQNAEADLLEALDRINKKHGSVLAKLGK